MWGVHLGVVGAVVLVWVGGDQREGRGEEVDRVDRVGG